MEAYRRLAAVTTPGDVDDIRAEWDDRYGPPPRSAVALLDDRSGGPFIARSEDAQRATLERLLPSYAGRDRLGRWRSRLLEAESERRLHMLVVRDLVAAFYRSPEGWRRAGHPRGYGEPAAHPLAYAGAADGRT